ncbi:DUF2934 domain-containing protein [Devosia sp. 1635]|uniref:DUF2934 domain-containing protein n=1 Tax=Devosia sp. 1635 TaxID=2726066 RepID=UPI00156780FA|nr:DUF2934 domain-containing protein [Devosia sp. 1635]
MDQDEHKEGKTRDRAYQLWEQEGRPEGRHEDHWRQASDEFSAQGEQDDEGGGGIEDMVPNPIGVPPAEALPPGSQTTGIDGPVGGTIGEQQAGARQSGGAGSSAGQAGARGNSAK